MNTKEYKKTLDENFILSEEIWNILYDFMHTPDGDKQCFDIYTTDGYKTLEEHELTNHEEVIQLRITIEDIVNSYTQLCDLFGDIMD